MQRIFTGIADSTGAQSIVMEFVTESTRAGSALKMRGQLSMPERVFSARQYAVVVAATPVGGWVALKAFIESNRETVGSVEYQQLTPAFGMREIIVSTRHL